MNDFIMTAFLCYVCQWLALLPIIVLGFEKNTMDRAKHLKLFVVMVMISQVMAGSYILWFQIEEII
jgi:hypothetical protein